MRRAISLLHGAEWCNMSSRVMLAYLDHRGDLSTQQSLSIELLSEFRSSSDCPLPILLEDRVREGICHVREIPMKISAFGKDLDHPWKVGVQSEKEYKGKRRSFVLFLSRLNTLFNTPFCFRNLNGPDKLGKAYPNQMGEPVANERTPDMDETNKVLIIGAGIQPSQPIHFTVH